MTNAGKTRYPIATVKESLTVGTVLRTPGIHREILAVTARGIEFRQDDFGGLHYCFQSHEAFQQWAKDAEVVHHAG